MSALPQPRGFCQKVNGSLRRSVRLTFKTGRGARTDALTQAARLSRRRPRTDGGPASVCASTASGTARHRPGQRPTCKRHMKLEGRARPGSHSEPETRLESRIHGWQEQHCLRAASPRLRPALRQTRLTGLKPPGVGGRGGTHGYKSNSGLQQKWNRQRIQKEICLSSSGLHLFGKCLVSL